VLWVRIGFNAESDPAFLSMRMWIQGFDDQNQKVQFTYS
jgi:hypothetical protein